MPDDASVWITWIIAAATVVGLAIWLGRGLVFRKSGDEVSLEIKAKPGPAESAASSRVSVGEGLEVENAEVGNVTGIEGEADDAPVEVLKGGKISGGSVVGDITGKKALTGNDAD